MLGQKQANILVIKTDGLAAFVASEPAFDAIRRAHPTAKISLLTTPGLQRIARAAPYFDQVAAMPNFRDAESKKAFVKQVKTAKFERVYELSTDEAGKKLRSSMGMFGPKWHSASQAPRSREHAGKSRVVRLLAGAGIEAEDRLPDFRWALEARKDSANMQPSWYGISGAFGLMLPGADPERRWSSGGYAGLATIMSRAGFMPVMAGPKELHHFGDEVAHEAPQLVDLTGKTDHLQLAALAMEASFFVSDCAEELQLALGVGCEGVIIGKSEDAGALPQGRHIVHLKANGDLNSVESPFVWRTLTNMGLIISQQYSPNAAQSR